MKQFIDKIKNKEDLSFEESKAAFELLMEGKKQRSFPTARYPIF